MTTNGVWVGGKLVAVPHADTHEVIRRGDALSTDRFVLSDDKTVDFAVRDSRVAFDAHRKAPAVQRRRWLVAASEAVNKRADDLGRAIVTSIGKPISLAMVEVKRVVEFLELCAMQLVHDMGDVLPLNAIEGGVGRFGVTRRVPLGVVAAITPFNAPANLLVQKVGPGLAVGNAVVVKPAPEGATVALMLAEIFADSGLPAGLFNVVTGESKSALLLAGHPQVAAVSVTGGVVAGRAIAQAAGPKSICLELGANSPNIVCSDAAIDDAAGRIAASAFESSGQQCVSAQRIIVDSSVIESFIDSFVRAASQLSVGDPWDPITRIGPMINEQAADRVESLVRDAVENGASVALQSQREGTTLSPAIVVGPSPSARIMKEEAFGPVAVVIKCDGLDEAIKIANDTEMGLQASCFTSSLSSALRVADELNVGSVWINEGSRYRLDLYPFGGTGDSGHGREGVRYAMEGLSQWKFVGFRMP